MKSAVERHYLVHLTWKFKKLWWAGGGHDVGSVDGEQPAHERDLVLAVQRELLRRQGRHPVRVRGGRRHAERGGSVRYCG